MGEPSSLKYPPATMLPPPALGTESPVTKNGLYPRLTCRVVPSANSSSSIAPSLLDFPSAEAVATVGAAMPTNLADLMDCGALAPLAPFEPLVPFAPLVPAAPSSPSSPQPASSAARLPTAIGSSGAPPNNRSMLRRVWSSALGRAVVESLRDSSSCMALARVAVAGSHAA
jgi:hypothetical protein